MAQAGLQVERVDDRVFTDFTEINIDGESVDFAQYDGRVTIVVNVASE